MSFVRRAMVYLGLVDEEYDYEDDYLTAPSSPAEPVTSNLSPEPVLRPVEADTVRTLPATASTVTPRTGSVRAVAPRAKPRVVVPRDFKDAQEVGDRFKANNPVIVNLQDADDGLRRRIIDFCSGLTYALEGGMEKVAKNVFMLTPTNVEVSAEDRRRLQEDGLYGR